MIDRQGSFIEKKNNTNITHLRNTVTNKCPIMSQNLGFNYLVEIIN